MRNFSYFFLCVSLVAGLSDGALAKKSTKREAAKSTSSASPRRDHKILFSNEADAKRACDAQGVTSAPGGRFTCVGGINKAAGIEQ